MKKDEIQKGYFIGTQMTNEMPVLLHQFERQEQAINNILIAKSGEGKAFRMK